jgi:sugar lactone lactonase YvrE
MKASIKILAMLTAMMTAMLTPVTSFSGASVKYRHVLSIYADDKDAGLKQPEGVACNENSVIIVADTGNGRLLRYIFQNNVLEKEVVEIKVPQISYPISAQINSKDEIYVLDGKQRRIVRLTPEGRFKDYLDPTGLPPPTSFVPRSFTIDGKDNLYILDVFSRRVLVLSPQGAYRRHIEFPKDSGFFSDLTVDFKGNVFLIDSTNAVVFSTSKGSTGFSPLTVKLKQYVRFPTGITIDKRGRIYLVDRNGSRIIILGQDGSFLNRMSGQGWKEGLLNYPSDICINSKGEVFVADTSNSRVQVFTVIE